MERILHLLWLVSQSWSLSSVSAYGGVLTPPAGSLLKNVFARHAELFFANGDLGAFHGLLNPLSSRSLVESCVMPVLMYGAEAWCINASLLSKLGSFQSEVGKKILRLPKFTANQVPLLALDCPTMRCRCLCAIFSSEQSTLSTEVFNTLTFSSVESTLLINQCRLLEQPYTQKFTDEVLTNPDVVLGSLKKQILRADCSLVLSEANTHPSQSIVAEVASHMGWLKVWDTALDHGPSGTNAVLSILKLLSKTVFADGRL